MKLGLVLVLACAACSTSKPATGTTTPMTSGSPSSTQISSSTPSSSTLPMDGTEACPNIQIKGSDSVAAGKQAEVTTTLIGGQGTPSYTWSVSKGTIASGQGTPHILVGTAGLAGSSITATVKLGGLKAECATDTATVTILVGT